MEARFEPGIEEPHFLLENHLKPLLMRIDGVANIQTSFPQKEVIIELNHSKVQAHNVDPLDLVERLRNQNFSMPSGSVRYGNKQLLIRALGQLRSIDEIRDIVISQRQYLRLRDIATVELKEAKREWFNRTNGKESIWIGVQRAASGNIVSVSEGVRNVIEDLKRRAEFQYVDIDMVWDQGEHIVQSIDNLRSSGLWGGLFAMFVLFFFLRSVCMTMIIVLVIPLSILMIMTVLYFVGWSLNIATMMGLMLSLGLVVDNGIVIVENIYRKRQAGVESRMASIEGAGEVGLATSMATLTTVVVFLPLILMSDEHHFAFWMFRIGLPVIVGLSASLLVALVLIPLAVQPLSTGRTRGELRLISKLRHLYISCLQLVLNNRLDAFIVVLLVTATIYYPLEVGKRTDHEGRRSRINLRFDTSVGHSLEYIGKYMHAIEDTLMNHKHEYGADIVRVWYRRGRGGAALVFKEVENLSWYHVVYEEIASKLGLRKRMHLGFDDVVKDIENRIPPNPGFTISINQDRTDEDASVSLNLYGPDTEVLTELANEVERRLRNIHGLERVYTDMDRSSSEIQVHLDREKLKHYGVKAHTISSQIGIRWPSTRLSGVELSKFVAGDRRELTMRMKLQDDDLHSTQHLGNLAFPTAEGKEISLKSLGGFHVAQSIDRIRRHNRQTMLTVTAMAAGEDDKKLFEQIDLAMEGFDMPRGYRWDKGARYVRMEETDKSQRFAIIMASTLVFLLMGMLFESFVLPLSVIVAIPFSFLGVYWTLFLTDTSFYGMSRIGAVILVGVVVNNAIVLVDLANRLRVEGMERLEALLEAGFHRFRPILMTTFTTVCGLIPMAIGNAEVIGTNYAPFGRTMIGGLLASVFVTLVVVPMCYTILDDLQELIGRIVASALRQRSMGRQPNR